VLVESIALEMLHDGYELTWIRIHCGWWPHAVLPRRPYDEGNTLASLLEMIVFSWIASAAVLVTRRLPHSDSRKMRRLLTHPAMASKKRKDDKWRRQGSK